EVGLTPPVPLFSARDVEAAVSPERAVEAVRDAFVAYARGEWTMPPKVYVPAYPAGDFRAMPALGGGHALLKWVTSFPGNPARGEGGGAEQAAEELGAEVAASLEEALAAALLVTMTPGHDVLLPAGTLRPGQHVSLMGADGPGKSEIAVDELLRTRIFCDDWEQASHNGELVHAIDAGRLWRYLVTDLGAVLSGTAEGRQHEEQITSFDSTGLAIQDL